MVIILIEGTTTEAQIIFTGDHFKAVVEELGVEEVECLPIIYQRESRIGLRIEIADRNKFYFLEERDDNLFRVYRTMRVVSLLKMFNTKIIGSAFLATDRIMEVSMLGFSPPLSNMIENRELREIMQELIPDELVRKVIESGKELSEKDKWYLKQELVAETIIYDERIAKLSIKSPQEIRLEIKEANNRSEEIFARVAPHLETYAEWFSDLEEGLEGHITSNVLSILLSGQFDFSDELAVAVGGFLAQSDYFNSLKGEAEEESFVGALYEERLNEIITGTIFWLSSEKDYSADQAARELDCAMKDILNSK